jgi:hypothetical protein
MYERGRPEVTKHVTNDHINLLARIARFLLGIGLVISGMLFAVSIARAWEAAAGLALPCIDKEGDDGLFAKRFGGL